MSFDGIFTHAMVAELNAFLASGRITKIAQPFAHELVLTVRASRKNQRLLISAHPTYARIQLTAEQLSNPENAPNFCMVLRKNLEGAIIDKISQLGNDRIIVFSFHHVDEIGDSETFELIVELMGRHSNVFLINAETRIIIDCLKHVPFYQNTYRALHPGAVYTLPPHQDKLDPFSFHQERDRLEQINWTEQPLQTVFQGLGKESVTEIDYIRQQGKLELSDAVAAFLKQTETVRPTLTVNGKKQHFTAFPYESLPGERSSFPTLSELLDRYYEEKAARDRIQQAASDLLHLISNEKKKNELKLEKLEATLKESEKADGYRLKGELVTAYLYQLEKGMKEVRLPNFYADEKLVLITLDPMLSPSQNAQKYFQKYQKLVKAVRHVEEQIAQTLQENDYLDSLETQIRLSDPQDLDALKEELYEAGYLRKRAKQKNKLKKKNKPHRFRADDGTVILVGKNNVQNDELTLKQARKNHYWFHAKNIPGSHVIVETADLTDELITQAATIAAYYSKYQNSAQVPVDYVQVRSIRKPNGAKPGFVIYEGQKTVYVTPEKEDVLSRKVE